MQTLVAIIALFAWLSGHEPSLQKVPSFEKVPSFAEEVAQQLAAADVRPFAK